MSGPSPGLDLEAWLAGEIGNLEASLESQGPTCQLDRQRAAPPGLKHVVGRYYVLRQARRLLGQGQDQD